MLGPYKAVENDAVIMQKIFKPNAKVQQTFRCGDLFLVDRGFRDAKPLLQRLGYSVLMPEFVNKTDKKGKLSTEKANSSRLITKCRWVVESRNGHLKLVWSIFQTIWPTKSLLVLKDDLKVCAALLNKFFVKLHTEEINYEKIASIMLERRQMKNNLSVVLRSQRFQNEVSKFKLVNIGELFFPNLSECDLKLIGQGIYQLKQSAAYCADNIKTENSIEIFECPSDICNRFLADIIERNQLFEPALLLSKWRSRHQRSRFYKTYVFVDTSVAGADCVIEYACECKHGLRTVGCCSHIMAKLWFLGLGRHLPQIRGPSKVLDDFFERQS